MSTNYKSKVEFATKELTAKEKVALKSFTEAIQLDDATKEGDILINIDYVVSVAVHNEKADTPDYMKYVYVDKDGTQYVSGSESLFKAYEEIAEEMEAETDTEWGIKVTRRESSNFKGKDFLTCVIV